MDSVMAIFASVGRVAPVVDVEAARKLNVRGNAHGILRGWFNWPYNFDPTWLQSCDGFEPKSQVASAGLRDSVVVTKDSPAS